MKKIFAMIICAALVLSLSACGNGNVGNNIFDEASPETSVLIYSCLTEDGGESKWLSDLNTEQELLKKLSSVRVDPIDIAWVDATYPMYGLEIGSKDGRGLMMLWTNGYLITRQGNIYEFDFDFPAVFDAVEWDSGSVRPLSRISDMPNSYYLAIQGGSWNKSFMKPADALENHPGISMGLQSWTDEAVTVSLKNDSDREWTYGEYFRLDVLLDGAWYTVPPEPRENWGFNDIANVLEPGQTREEIYHLLMYGALPEGQYRLVMEGLAVER